MRARWSFLLLLPIPFLCSGIAILLYNLPPVYDRIDRFSEDYRVKIQRSIYTAEEVRFAPQEQVKLIVQATLQALSPAASSLPSPAYPVPTNTPLPTATPLPTETPAPSPTPPPTATPLPSYIALTGVKNEIESRNNCGPATLSMALSYWGWQGDQTVTRSVLRPNLSVDDKNVMPAEMVGYVHAYTGLRALVRVGGDLNILKQMIAAGFPVIVEKGHITTGWIGHYILLTGYDDSQGHFFSQDSLVVAANTPMPYAELVDHWWRHFNYLYMVIYPQEWEAALLSILGPHADAAFNFLHAAEKARVETGLLQGRELFFAWYNLGSSLTGLGDYAGAAQAYDRAYADVYPTLKQEKRPWRVLWYQTGPYLAYYSAGRYEDVVNLADATLLATGSPVLEETFYWRGMARKAMGDYEGAKADFQKAVRLNPNATPALEEIQQIDEETDG